MRPASVWIWIKRKKFLFLGILLVLVVGLGSGACKLAPQYDELVALNENVSKEWAGVESQLQRRYDLIPNLVEVAKGTAAYESSVLTDIAGAHNSYTNARTVSARIDGSYKTEAALRQFVVVRATFPTLQATARFASLMRSLEKTEDQILKQRLRYNEAVAAFNSRAKSLEGRVVCWFGHLELAVYYNPPEPSQQPVSVLATPSSSSVPSPLLEVDAGRPDAAADAADASPPPPPSLASQYFVKGVMLTDGTREAIVVGPRGQSLNLKKGMTLPGTEARVVAIDEGGVTLENRGEQIRLVRQ